MTPAEQRKRPSHHVVHDLVNLISAAREISRSPKPPLNSHVFYSFLLQYRKFDDFFSNKRRVRKKIGKGDIDMLAKDFISPKVRFVLPEWAKWDTHMNAHAFHINYLRTRNSRAWHGHQEIPKMVGEFKTAWKKFFDNLPDVAKQQFKEEIELKLVRGSEFANLRNELYRG